MAMTFQDLIEQVETGVLPIRLGPVFHLDQVSLAHALMEQTSARGKNVVLTNSGSLANAHGVTHPSSPP